MLARENPSQMAVNEAVTSRRMDILQRIGLQVMLAMLGGPPQNAFLRARLGKEGECELKCPAGRVGAVRKVPVVTSADREDAQPIHRRAQCQRLPCDARPDRRDAGDMHQREGKGRGVDDIVDRAYALLLAAVGTRLAAATQPGVA